MSDSEAITKRIAVASKRTPADVVLKNAEILNVFTGEIMDGDIAVVDGYIAGIGSYDGKEEIDATGKTVVPGFIDGHVHIESTMLTPREFSKLSLLHGVTTVITDPHEIANVAGSEGIQFLLDDAEELPMDIFINLPSSVPATSFENNGATLDAEALQPFLAHPKVLGLAEVMDFSSVASGEKQIVDKIAMVQANGGVIDGHAAGLEREDLNIYMAAGIRTDHESVSSEEGKARLDLGMYLMVREGTVAKDLDALLPVITAQNSRRCMFVTDDILLDDFMEQGSINHIVRLAIEKGLDPAIAIQMATLNAAECFGLRHLGAVAPGYQADFLLLDDLQSVSIHQVYKRGRCVVDKGEMNKALFPKLQSIQSRIASLPTFHTKKLTENDLELSLKSTVCHIIEIIPNSIVTKHVKESVQVENGLFVPSTETDHLKMAVIERHKGTGNVGVGIVKGFRLKRGAIATSVAHDSHNIVVVGVSDQEMLRAVDEILKTNGGLVVVDGEEVLATLPLPVGGLMSNTTYKDTYKTLQKMNAATSKLGASESFNLFLTLSFLTLPVIPELKLTDQGLFHFSSFSLIDTEV
ncbi:adenine deaminase [Oceanobacillus polygoni]|uniref:Adenine deaminase n=1 Tax=Oceanobacillus polygoni TaxID=1235259 RepID=A0A9X0YPP3_9BACI|nr:adenine deaminase [Oceanobacillus polygoni]MBP2076808.1 adenine deaminase [Oceanobacillus polygoni]